MSGHIEDFREKGDPSGPKILRGNPRGVEVEIQRHSAVPSQQTEGGFEIRRHEEIVVEDDKIRQKERKPDDPEIRIRVTDKHGWEKVLQDEDEEEI